MAFNFPDSPAVNDEYTAHGVTYKWSGTVWEAQGGGTYVAKIGDTMTGDLKLEYKWPYFVLNSMDGAQPWSGIEFHFNSVHGFGISAEPAALHFEYYTAAGVFLGPAIKIARTTGNVEFLQQVNIAKSLTVNGIVYVKTPADAAVVLDRDTSADYSSVIFTLNDAYQWSIDVGLYGDVDDFAVYRYDDSANAFAAIAIKRATGEVFIENKIQAQQYKIGNNAVLSKAVDGAATYHVFWGANAWDGNGADPNAASIWIGDIADRAIFNIADAHVWQPVGAANYAVMNATRLWLKQTTPSTDVNTGALIIAGGVGIGGNVNVGGSLNAPYIGAATSYFLAGTLFAQRTEGNTYTRIYDAEGVSIFALGASFDPTNYHRNTTHAFMPRVGGSPYTTIDAAGVNIISTTPSTSPTTGALRVAGGVGIAGALWLGGAFNFTGQGHIAYTSPGAGFWYDSAIGPNRFFLGTEPGVDAFRLFCTQTGGNVFLVDNAMAVSFSGRIIMPLGSDNQMGDITVARSPDIGVVHFGSSKTRFLYFDGTQFHLAGGNLTVAGSKVTATHYDAATATLGYQLGGVAAFFRSGNYHVLQSQDGGGNLILGQAAEPSNYYTNTNHYFRDRANNVIMSLIGGTLSIQHSIPELVINKQASGQAARIYGRTGGNNRWHITMGNQGAESGGDAGSDFIIARYLDNGASGTALAITRSNGAVVIPGTLTVQSAGSFQTLSTTGAVSFPGIVNLTSVGAIGQNSSGNIQITAPTGHHSFISFHIAGQFATQFGLAPDGNFYMGGWSHPSVSYRFWTTRDFASVPAIGTFVANGRLAFAADYVHYYYAGFNEPYTGAVVTGMSPTDASGNATARYRYLQLYTTGWFTVGYA